VNKISVADIHADMRDSAAAIVEEDKVSGHEFAPWDIHAIASHVGGVAV